MAENSPGSEVEKRVSRALQLFEDGKREAALKECKKVIEADNVDARSAARTAKLLDALGQTEASTQVRDMVLARLVQEAEENPDDASVQSETGLLHEFFGDVDTASGYYRTALELDTGDLKPAFQLSAIALKNGDAAEAIAVWEPIVAAAVNPGKVLLTLARMLGQSGFREEAETVIERARPLCGSIKKEFDFVAAGIRGDAKDLDQHGMAVELFDSFAASYDKNLKVLQNNGPDMIARMLDELKLSKDKSRNVLDAGCGTGLCAKHLRPFAKTLAGADISSNMLNVCLEKKLFDTLTRTDLSEPVTYPEGVFELVVAADVLVYFGDLRTVFANIANKLSPGGWLVFTVEKALPPEPSVGFRLGASGRYAHTLDYIDKTLIEAGLGRSKQHFEDRIRKELGEPVTGYAIAAQKPALSIFG